MAPITTFNESAQSWHARLRVLCLTDAALALQLCADSPDQHDPQDRALRLNFQAIALETLGETAQSDQCWLEFRAALSEVESATLRSHLELLRGRVYWQHGLNWRALEEFRAVHARALANNDSFLEANALNMIAKIHDVFDDYSSALESLLQALPIHRRAGNLRGEVQATYWLGIVYDNQGMKKQSLEYFQEAARLVCLTDDRIFEADCLKNLGEALADAGSSACSRRSRSPRVWVMLFKSVRRT
jgi:tetratricopeptide (TPR) repeat protein